MAHICNLVQEFNGLVSKGPVVILALLLFKNKFDKLYAADDADNLYFAINDPAFIPNSVLKMMSRIIFYRVSIPIYQFIFLKSGIN